MTASDQLTEIFDQAKSIPAGEKLDAFLKVACRGDLELKKQVISLLQAREHADEFLEDGPTISPEIEEELARLKPEAAGDRIGPYKLIEKVGEGGFGTVWVADQEHPVRRRVAMKVIKVGMDTKEVIARFEQERQALAMMEHPNIAKVFDAGSTTWGRPYFVMELVRGLKITDFCDQKNLPTSERIALFIQVCSAVEHAHQQGIIHRDLKPGNILISQNSGVPAPKVIDFGVAKATHQHRFTDLTIYTQFQQMIGTPLYMSPEQAQSGGTEVDLRSDIYTLGVLLYELLTGRTPFDPDELIKVSYDEIRRVIQEDEPPTPSMYLRGMAAETRASVAHHRQVEPSKLTSELKGDLDWIVMKALEKDRRRRYESAQALAADLQRHLQKLPVVARPPSVAYQIRRHVARNQAGYVAAAIAVISMLAALIVGMRISPHRGKLTQTPAATREASATATTVKVHPLRVVSGNVTAEDTGLPLKNARIRIAAPSRDMRFVQPLDPNLLETRSDDTGNFKIPVPEAETFSIDVMAPGYETVSGPIMRGSRFKLGGLPFTGQATQGISIKLARTLYVAGVVVDGEGRPFAGAEVEATLTTANSTAYVKTSVTNHAGRFEIFDYPIKTRGENGVVRFEHPGMLRSEIENVYALSEGARQNLRVVLRRGHQVRGTVISGGGRPAVHTRVEAVPADPREQYKYTFTDGDGNYVIPGLPDGEIVVRTHSLILEQKARATVRLAGTDIEANLRLEPVLMKDPVKLVTLLGMKVADITPELKAAYDLHVTKGVLIVAPGRDHQRLGIGPLEEGQYFWMVGNKTIANLREMVDEMLRINALERPAGFITEGYAGFIRVVFSHAHGSNTQYLKLTSDDTASLKKLREELSNQ